MVCEGGLGAVMSVTLGELKANSRSSSRPQASMVAAAAERLSLPHELGLGTTAIVEAASAGGGQHCAHRIRPEREGNRIEQGGGG